MRRDIQDAVVSATDARVVTPRDWRCGRSGRGETRYSPLLRSWRLRDVGGSTAWRERGCAARNLSADARPTLPRGSSNVQVACSSDTPSASSMTINVGWRRARICPSEQSWSATPLSLVRHHERRHSVRSSHPAHVRPACPWLSRRSLRSLACRIGVLAPIAFLGTTLVRQAASFDDRSVA